MLRKDVGNCVVVGRLFGDARSAQVERVRGLLRARDDVDRDVGASRGSCLQQVEQHEAVDVRQAEIERDRARLELARHRHRAGAGGRDDAPSSPASRAKSSRIDAKVGSSSTISTKGSPSSASRSSVTSNGSAARSARSRRYCRSARALADRRQTGCRASSGTKRVKVDPSLGYRTDLQLAAQQAGDLAADRQAEAGAAIFAAGRAVGLLERLEDQLLLVLRDADAGVGDRDLDRVVERRAAPDGWCSSPALPHCAPQASRCHAR